MDQQGKIWGTTTAVFQSPFFSVHLLQIRAGCFCSEHRHDRKLNHFSVLSGRLQVHQWPAGVDQDQPDTTRIGPGESLTVPVGVWHQFYAEVPTVAVEVYEAAPVEEDIERRTTGGSNLKAAVRVPDPNEAGLP